MGTPAHLIAIGLGAAMNDNIRGWVHQFNFFPPIPLAAHKSDFLQEQTFEGLLQRLIDSTHKNFILIIHGYADGSGIYLRLVRDQTKLHTYHYDLQVLMDADQGAVPHKKLLHTMGIKRADVDRLLGLMRQVRAKKIDCIEFRSCNLGRNDISLDRFRRFLGAKRVGAPNLHTVFGLVGVIVNPQFEKMHRKHHVGAGWETYNYPSELETPKLVCCFQLNNLQKPESGGHMATDQEPTLNAWINQWVMLGGRHSPGHKIAMHALWIADQVVHEPGHKPRMVPVAIEITDLDTRDPLGGLLGPVVMRFIPPLSPIFKKHIIYSPKTG